MHTSTSLVTMQRCVSNMEGLSKIVVTYLSSGLLDATLDNIPTGFLKRTCN